MAYQFVGKAYYLEGTGTGIGGEQRFGLEIIAFGHLQFITQGFG